jgi:hypothetical protein
MSTEDLITIDIPVPAPYVPSELEARNYYYGLESRPRLIARSSPDVWKKPTGPEAFMEPKELTPLGMHPLNTFWEKTVGPAMDLYFQEKGVECTSMIPLRIGIAGQSPPPVIFVGVNPAPNLDLKSLFTVDISFSKMASTMFTWKYANRRFPTQQ